MKAFLIDSKTDEFGEVEVEPSLSEYYRLLGCDCIDIITRRVLGRQYDIVLDDEGLFKENRVTGHCINAQESLVGSLIVFGIDDEDPEQDFRPLTEDQVREIGFSVMEGGFSDGSVHPVLTYTI